MTFWVLCLGLLPISAAGEAATFSFFLLLRMVMNTSKAQSLQSTIDDAIAIAQRFNEMFFTLGTQTVQNVLGTAVKQAITTGEEVTAAAHALIETTTETVGRLI